MTHPVGTGAAVATPPHQYTFTVLLWRDPESGDYTATVPSLPGCVAQGASVDEALDLARGAVRLHVEGLLEDGEEVPEEDTPPLVGRLAASL